MSIETRTRVLGVLFLAFALALLARLFYWQVREGAALAAEGSSQHLLGAQVSAPRGNIYASDGSLLVASIQSWTVYAALPELTLDPKSVANTLAPYLVNIPEPKEDEEVDEQRLLLNEANRLEALLTRGDVVWVPLGRDVSTETKEQIENLEIEGVGFEATESREYAEASAAAHLLGFVGKNDNGADTGYFGIEGFYDLTLSGKPGFIKREKDATGVPLLFGAEKDISAFPGVDLITNLDKTVQVKIEKALGEALERYGAQAGTVIVMNPKTGGILGMASSPGYDPREYYDYGDALFRNPSISDSFEPGSIFKPIVMASALDAGVVEPNTICDSCHEPLKVDKYFIKTWNNEYTSDATMVDVIKNSDNVGMAFVGARLGADRMYDYITSFGFGKLTGIDLQGEASPKVRERGGWNVVDLATTSFGQGIAATPIQMVKAIATIANDGVSVAPQVVDKVAVGGVEDDIKPVLGDRVISKVAADQITDMMVTAVKDGEAKWAVPKGFSIAGKTGTAQIPVEGHYDEDKTIASFVGFAPADDPKMVMLVTLREPESSPWASETAAPLWFSIALDLFPHFGIRPE